MDRPLLDRSIAYIDSWLAWRCASAGLPGCAVAISHHNEVLLSAGYGKADLETGRRLAADAVFRVASHSKSFTATAVLQLAETGKIRLDDPVARHLGWLGEHKDRRFRQITARQLLCHGAGLLRDGADSDFWQLAKPFPDRDELRTSVLGSRLVTEPNVSLKYSNLGYGLLGLLIEEKSGKSYREYTDARIVGPAGLEATVAEPRPRTPKAVTGYSRRDRDGRRRPVPHVATGALAPATGFASTAVDLCRYFSAHFVGSNKLLGDVMKREMQRVHFRVHRPSAGGQDYGLGLMLQRVGERQVFGHGGAFPGQITHTLAAPADGLVVTALTSSVDGPAAEIVTGIYQVIDHFQRAEGLAPPALKRLEGRYANLWSVLDVVAAGKQVVVGSPDSWSPLADPDRLERVDSRTLRIADTSSYGSAGELVRFALEAGRVTSVR